MTDVPVPADLNGLTKESLKEALLTQNFLPRQHDHREELPPVFHSKLFKPEIAEVLRQFPIRKGGYDLIPFKRTRHPNIPRVMGIPHPRAYAELVHAICEGWDEIAQRCNSPNSQLQFKLHDDGRMLVHAYDQIADDGIVEDQDPLADFGMNFMLRTDITNFYPSIYSHALPWALVGHATAKKKRDDGQWFNILDRGIRNCQRGETRGLPIGPGTSSILAEALLFPIDKFMREKGYQFKRYIDDYSVFLESSAKCNDFLKELSQILEKYSLSLNIRKTIIDNLPITSRETWVTEIDTLLGEISVGPEPMTDNADKPTVRKLRVVIDKAIELSSDYPDGSVIKYTFSSLIERFQPRVKAGISISDDPAERFLEDSIFRHAYHSPVIIPVIQRWLQHFPSIDQKSETRVVERLIRLLDRSFELGQSDNICWCLHYLLQVKESTTPVDINRCCKIEEPMVIAMGYYFAKTKGLSLEPFRTWAISFREKVEREEVNNYDIDRVWLPLYQMYYDDIIDSMPYSENDDRNIFSKLKESGVTFFEIDHPDIEARCRKFAGLHFGPISESGVDNPIDTLAPK